MTKTVDVHVPRTTIPLSKGRQTAHFLRHLAEMVLAMLAGMFLLAPVWAAAHTGLGLAGVFTRPDVGALVMATNMTIGMAVWMRYRGHGWTGIAEMGAAMYLPFVVLFGPYWAGALSGGTLSHVGHLLMVPAMVLVMLRRRVEYSRPHPPRASTMDGARRGGRVAAALRHRWPTGLALLMTFTSWTDPAVPPAWVLLALPGTYLVIGLARRTLREPGMRTLQLAGLVGYLALVVLAMSVDGDLARYLIGAGWLVHAGWDVLHHRTGKVVPRGYAEWCAVVDVVIGLTIIFLV